MITIEYYRKDVYGRQLIYILSKEFKGVLYRLTGKETLNDHDIVLLQKLGVEMKEVMQPRPVNLGLQNA